MRFPKLRRKERRTIMWLDYATAESISNLLKILRQTGATLTDEEKMLIAVYQTKVEELKHAVQ